MAARLVLPELARDSQLETLVTSGYCVHIFSETPTVTRKEVWGRAKKIGAGGFGTVWLETCINGHQNGNNVYRAVKELQLPSDVPTQEAIAKYGRELEALAKFSQAKYVRCFVKSYGWYHGSSSISICLEYLPLGDLQAFLARRADPRLCEPEVQQIISQILDGLVFMHGEGFAHGDLKPANILIKSHQPTNWWVKLSDFGLSKRNEATRGTTAIRGTPGFMAPELLGYLSSDYPLTGPKLCAADLWNLGEITFQLATAKAVFKTQTILTKYTLGRVKFPVSELQHVFASPAMVGFITSAMLVDYQQRPTAAVASAHPWLQGLKTVSAGLPSRAVFNYRQDESARETFAIDHTESSDIEYLPWSTVSRAPVISPASSIAMRPDLEASMGPINVAQAASGLDVSNMSSHYTVDGSLHSQLLTPKVLTKEAMDEVISLSANGMASLFFRITTFEGTQRGSDRLIVSPDSSKLVTTSSNHGIGLWSMEKKALVRILERACDYAAFSVDSGQIATVKQGGPACVVEANLNRLFEDPLKKFFGKSEQARCVAFSPGGDQVVAGTAKGTIIVWDVNGQKAPQKIKAYSIPVLWVAYWPAKNATPSNKYDIVALGTEGSLGLWTYEVRSILPNRWVRVAEGWWGFSKNTGIHVPEDISAAASSKSFDRLAVATFNGFIGVWYGGIGTRWIHGLECESGVRGHDEGINTLDFSPDSNLLLSASKEYVCIWKIPGALPVAMVRAPAGLTFRSIAFSSNSSSLVSTSSDDVVRLWDTGNVQNLSDIQNHLHHATFVAVSPDQRYVASVTRKLHNIPLHKSSHPFTTECVPMKQPFNNNGITTLMVWDVVQARPLTLMGGHGKDILSVSFSTNSKRVGSVSADHVLRIWQVETGVCLDTIAPNATHLIPSAVLSNGLRYCASVFRYHDERISQSVTNINEPNMSFAISLYNIPTDAHLQQSNNSHLWKTLQGMNTADTILFMIFSPDTTKLAAIDQRDNVTIWDTATGCMTIRLPDPTTPPLASGYGTHTYEVDSPALQFIPSKAELIAFSGLHSARVWNLESGGQPLRHIGSSRVFTKPRKQQSIGANIDETSGRNSSLFPYYSFNTPLAASSDGTRCVLLHLATDKLVLWDMVNCEMVKELTSHTSQRVICQALFSPDSRWLVTASSEDIVVNDAVTGREQTRIMHGLSWPLRTVAFWPGSQYIVSGCYKSTLQFWDVCSGAMVKYFEGHTGRPSFVL